MFYVRIWKYNLSSFGFTLQDLNCLIGRYLTPLQKETFLTQDEVCKLSYLCVF